MMLCFEAWNAYFRSQCLFNGGKIDISSWGAVLFPGDRYPETEPYHTIYHTFTTMWHTFDDPKCLIMHDILDYAHLPMRRDQDCECIALRLASLILEIDHHWRTCHARQGRSCHAFTSLRYLSPCSRMEARLGDWVL